MKLRPDLLFFLDRADSSWCLKAILWLLVIVRDDGTDPDVAVVPEDDACSTKHVVEVVLAALHKRWGNCYQGALRKLEKNGRRGGKGE